MPLDDRAIGAGIFAHVLHVAGRVGVYPEPLPRSVSHRLACASLPLVFKEHPHRGRQMCVVPFITGRSSDGTHRLCCCCMLYYTSTYGRPNTTVGCVFLQQCRTACRPNTPVYSSATPAVRPRRRFAELRFSLGRGITCRGFLACPYTPPYIYAEEARKCL